jgi:regulatory protein
VRRSDLNPDDAAAARGAALDMLARRDRASGQIFTKLTDRGYTAEVAAQVVAALAGENLINDRRYVEHFVAYHAQRGQGPLKVRGELRQSGVDGELIDELLAAYSEWDVRAQEARKKKFGAAAPAHYAEKARQSRFLAYRGFTGAQIRSALDTTIDYET